MPFTILADKTQSKAKNFQDYFCSHHIRSRFYIEMEVFKDQNGLGIGLFYNLKTIIKPNERNFRHFNLDLGTATQILSFTS